MIEVSDLRCTYGDHVAVDGIDFTVEQGEIFALLGANGAGKTTTLETLEGHQAPAGGRVAAQAARQRGAPACPRRRAERLLGLDLAPRAHGRQRRVRRAPRRCGDPASRRADRRTAAFG